MLSFLLMLSLVLVLPKILVESGLYESDDEAAKREAVLARLREIRDDLNAESVAVKDAYGDDWHVSFSLKQRGNENGEGEALEVTVLQNTTDDVAAQFFLKNVHPEMRNAAYKLFGKPELNFRPNVFGELMRVLISPFESIEAVVKSVLPSGEEPDITLHMRMLTCRSMWPVQAALSCIRKDMENFELVVRPKVVVVSDTPSFISTIKPSLQELAEVDFDR